MGRGLNRPRPAFGRRHFSEVKLLLLFRPGGDLSCVQRTRVNMPFHIRLPALSQAEAQPVTSSRNDQVREATPQRSACAASVFSWLASFGLGSHLVKAGEGGADLPDGRDGMDLMSEES